MDVRIGVTQSPKEIEVELGTDVERDKITADINKQLRDPEGILWLTDRRGRQVGVPSSKVAYIEIGASGDDRRVGFGAP